MLRKSLAGYFVFYYLICLGFLMPDIYAQEVVAGGRSSAMGNASVTLIDGFSAFNNQACLGFLENFTAGLFAQRRYLLSELNTLAASVAYPVNRGTSGTFAVSFNYYGFELYNQKKAGLAYGRAFGKKVAAGVQFDYLGFDLDEYGTKHTVTFEAGMLFKAHEQLFLGVHAFNPVRIQLSDYQDEKVPTVLRFGLGYHPSDLVTLVGEAEKHSGHPMTFRAGLEYNVLKQLILRTGIQTNPTQVSFGIGTRLSGFRLDLASTVHPVLGVTPQVSLAYAINKPRQSPEAPDTDIDPTQQP